MAFYTALVCLATHVQTDELCFAGYDKSVDLDITAKNPYLPVAGKQRRCSIPLPVINLIALGLSLWLGLYIVTRTPRRAISWLTAGWIWRCGCFSCLYDPGDLSATLAGWTAVRPLAVLGLPLWVHASVLLRNEVRPLMSKVKWVQTTVVIVTYLTAVALAFLDTFSSDPQQRGRCTLSALVGDRGKCGSLLCLQLVQCYRLAADRLAPHLSPLLIGTVTTAFGGVCGDFPLLSIVAIPTVFGDTLMIAAVIAIGYAIARLTARSARRSIAIYSIHSPALG